MKLWAKFGLRSNRFRRHRTIYLWKAEGVCLHLRAHWPHLVGSERRTCIAFEWFMVASRVELPLYRHMGLLTSSLPNTLLPATQSNTVSGEHCVLCVRFLELSRAHVLRKAYSLCPCCRFIIYTIRFAFLSSSLGPRWKASLVGICFSPDVRVFSLHPNLTAPRWSRSLSDLVLGTIWMGREVWDIVMIVLELEGPLKICQMRLFILPLALHLAITWSQVRGSYFVLWWKSIGVSRAVGHRSTHWEERGRSLSPLSAFIVTFRVGVLWWILNQGL